MVDLSHRNILITGGNGFIGSNFVEYILENYEGMTIMNFDKRGVGSRDIFEKEETSSVPYFVAGKNNRYHSQKNDIRLLGHNYLSNLKLPDLKYDYIFHFAAESHVDRSISGPMEFVSNNVIGTTALLDYHKDHQHQARMIVIDTDEVYGHLGLGDKPFTENSPLAPRSPYAASKAAASLVALSYQSTYGLDIVVTRCCNNYGPHQHDEKFIPTVLRKLLNNEKIPVYGTGQNIREWIHVEDHNKAVLEIAEIGESGKVYNIGSGLELTNIELIAYLMYEVGNFEEDLPIEFVEDRKGHDFRYAISSVNWKNNLDKKGFPQGIKETVKFYKEKYGK